MRRLAIYIFPFLLLAFCVSPKSNGQIVEKNYENEERITRVLIVQKRTNGKQNIFTEGMKVRYWTKTSENSKVGFIYEFKRDDIVIDGMNVPLNQLTAIKIKDGDAHNAFKVIGPVLGIAGAVVGFGVGTTLFRGQPVSAFPILTGSIGLISGFIPLIKSNMKYHMRRYHFQILDVAPEQLQYNEKGKLEYISMVEP